MLTDKNKLIWESGGHILSVPAGTEDKEKYAADYLYNNGKETLDILRVKMGRTPIVQEAFESALEGEEEEKAEEPPPPMPDPPPPPSLPPSPPHLHHLRRHPRHRLHRRLLALLQHLLILALAQH